MFWQHIVAQPTIEPLPPKLELQEVTHTDPNIIPTLSLREAILLAMRNNPNVRNAELQRVVDKFSLAVAHNQFWPQVSLSGQALYQNGTSPNYSALPSVSLLTPIGTQISSGITQIVNNNETPGIITNATVSVTQPLLRGFGTTVTEANLHNAIDTEAVNKLNFKNQVITSIVAVVNAYYQLVQAHNNLTIDKLSLTDAQNTLNQTLAKIKVGKAAPADQIQQRATIANRQLAINVDQSNIAQYYQNLLSLLWLDPSAQLNVEQKLQHIFAKIPSLGNSIDIALKNNIAYQQALINYKITERNLVVAKDQQRWELDAVGALNQPIGNNGPFAQSSRSVSLNLNIPIHDMARQQQWVNAKVALDQAKLNMDQLKRQLVTNTTNAYNNVQFARQQVVLAENAVHLAQQSLDVAKMKFKYGKATTFELTSLQVALTTAQLGYVAQQIQYANLVEAFFQNLGTTLEKWQIELSY